MAENVDDVMAAIPVDWRYRWCGGEAGPCACLGCVQIGIRKVMVEAFTGKPYRGDPEYIDEGRIPRAVFERYEITKAEWEDWVARHPDQHLCPSCERPMVWCEREGDDQNGCAKCWKCEHDDCSLVSSGGHSWRKIRLES